jgi:bacillithiol biosynthesis deacetylase BshB1
LAFDCLAIAAHPDDTEITCGGTIAKLVDLGYSVAIVDLAGGEMGTRGDEHIRAAEALAAAKVLGVQERVNLNLPDAHLQPDLTTRAAIAQKIRDYKPQLVILPHWEQRHPDHRVCSQVGYDACFYAGLKKAKLEGEPHRPRKILYSTYYRSGVRPTFVVNISEQLERKLEAVRAYKSQFPAEIGKNMIFVPGIDIFEYIRVRDRELGMQVRVGYAEGYVQKELLAIDDPINLGGISI